MTELAVLDPTVGYIDEPVDPRLDLFEEIERLKQENPLGPRRIGFQVPAEDQHPTDRERLVARREE